ncbi:hypothetical protein DFP72DRAFT_1042315 [Ephemerocybe angulata]|uniref:DUF7923 domain-containing protein n=1 Tax=Ephemerocybe angulata TaxID=980116 RepID=A0A8H6I8B8_9AGAR|nr:hypothetical protein DFP72DRAFT_1042315 [Tulosesus angulatus]
MLLLAQECKIREQTLAHPGAFRDFTDSKVNYFLGKLRNEGTWSEPLSSNTFDEFLYGFQEAIPCCVSDIGPGKERADAHVIAWVQSWLKFPQVAKIVVGVGHDNGYANELGRACIHGQKEKIHLLKTKHTPIVQELQSLGLATFSIPSLFQTDPPRQIEPIKSTSALKREQDEALNTAIDSIRARFEVKKRLSTPCLAFWKDGKCNKRCPKAHAAGKDPLDFSSQDGAKVMHYIKIFVPCLVQRQEKANTLRRGRLPLRGEVRLRACLPEALLALIAERNGALMTRFDMARSSCVNLDIKSKPIHITAQSFVGCTVFLRGPFEAARRSLSFVDGTDRGGHWNRGVLTVLGTEVLFLYLHQRIPEHLVEACIVKIDVVIGRQPIVAARVSDEEFFLHGARQGRLGCPNPSAADAPPEQVLQVERT